MDVLFFLFVLLRKLGWNRGEETKKEEEGDKRRCKMFQSTMMMSISSEKEILDFVCRKISLATAVERACIPGNLQNAKNLVPVKKRRNKTK